MLSIPSGMIAQNRSIIHSYDSLDKFITAEKHQNTLTHETMISIFSYVARSYNAFLKLIRVDIARCKRYIRNHKNDTTEQKILLDQLRRFYFYAREHKNCFLAIEIHNDLNQRYAIAFNDPLIVQLIEEYPTIYGLSENCKNKCTAYFKKIQFDLAKLEKLEDMIHGNHSILKAHNYVYKFELIKVRNHVYHSNRYKFENCYFQ